MECLLKSEKRIFYYSLFGAVLAGSLRLLSLLARRFRIRSRRLSRYIPNCTAARHGSSRAWTSEVVPLKAQNFVTALRNLLNFTGPILTLLNANSNKEYEECKKIWNFQAKMAPWIESKSLAFCWAHVFLELFALSSFIIGSIKNWKMRKWGVFTIGTISLVLVYHM